MKKIFCLLLVTLLATVLFADVAVNLGVGFDTINSDISASNGSLKTKRNSFSLTAGLICIQKSNFVVFDDFSLLFGNNEKRQTADGEWFDYFGKDGSLTSKLVFKNHLGIRYSFMFDSPVVLSVGVDYALAKTKIGSKFGDSYTDTITSKGVGLSGKLIYLFNNGFRAFADAKVDFMFNHEFSQSGIGDPVPADYELVCHDNALTVNYGFSAGLVYYF